MAETLWVLAQVGAVAMGLAAWLAVGLVRFYRRSPQTQPCSQATGGVAQRLYTIPITCQRDGREHLVTDEAAAVGRHNGEYEALCGYVLLAAPMVAPVGRRCARCTAATIASTAREAHRGTESQSTPRTALEDAPPTRCCRSPAADRPMSGILDPNEAATTDRHDAATLLVNYFLDNAEAGDHAANDHLIGEMIRRQREQQPARRSRTSEVGGGVNAAELPGTSRDGEKAAHQVHEIREQPTDDYEPPQLTDVNRVDTVTKGQKSRSNSDDSVAGGYWAP